MVEISADGSVFMAHLFCLVPLRLGSRFVWQGEVWLAEPILGLIRDLGTSAAGGNRAPSIGEYSYNRPKMRANFRF